MSTAAIELHASTNATIYCVRVARILSLSNWLKVKGQRRPLVSSQLVTAPIVVGIYHQLEMEF